MLTQSTAEESERIADQFSELENEAASFFGDFDNDAKRLEIARSLDMRYAGQEHTVRVPVAGGATDIERMNHSFHELHERAYTFQLDSDVEIVNFHVTGTIPIQKPSVGSSMVRRGPVESKATRQVDFDEWGSFESTVYERSSMTVDFQIEGPAIIEEPAATTVVYPEMTASLDEGANILINTGVGG